MVNNVVIMAGGAGNRLWPASMGKTPKQFMRINDDVTLFSRTIDRAFGLGIHGFVYIITHENHVEAAIQECKKEIRERRERIVIMAEPIARNTAPALALGLAGMQLAGASHDTTLAIAADHLISPMKAFVSSVKKASTEAENGYIMIYGIVPHHPATGYGYIETGNRIGDTMEVLSFREKPDEETAQKYITLGQYYWNSGLFTYKNDILSRELERHAPETARAFAQPKEAWFNRQNDHEITILLPSALLRQRYKNCPSISIDYAVMEKTSNIRMIQATFQWNDVGSWDVMADLAPPPREPIYSYNSSNNFVYANCPVALCGVDNLIVVVENNRVMVCKKGSSQLVKEAASADLHTQESST